MHHSLSQNHFILKQSKSQREDCCCFHKKRNNLQLETICIQSCSRTQMRLIQLSDVWPENFPMKSLKSQMVSDQSFYGQLSWLPSFLHVWSKKTSRFCVWKVQSWTKCLIKAKKEGNTMTIDLTTKVSQHFTCKVHLKTALYKRLDSSKTFQC